MELELIKYVVERFAESKDEIEYQVEEKENAVEVTVLLAASDMGKVIGKQGRIAKAIRTLMKGAAKRVGDGKKVVVDILD